MDHFPDFTQEYYGMWPEDLSGTTITLRLFTKVEECADCPASLLCIASKPLRGQQGFLCSRCACLHLWWPEKRIHVVCGQIRQGVHHSATVPDPSGLDYAMVALYGPGADLHHRDREDWQYHEAPCCDAWNQHGLSVPVHPSGDGNPKYEREMREARSRAGYHYPYERMQPDPYDCIDYFNGKVPRRFATEKGIYRVEPISPFQLREPVIGNKTGTHGRRRMRGRF